MPMIPKSYSASDLQLFVHFFWSLAEVRIRLKTNDVAGAREKEILHTHAP